MHLRAAIALAGVLTLVGEPRPWSSSGAPPQTLPRALSPWGNWTPPPDLREREVAFAQELEKHSDWLIADRGSRPLDFQRSCDMSHMANCSWCPVQDAALASAHARAEPATLLAHGPLTMIDDRLLASWAGLVRFRRPPEVQRLEGVKGREQWWLNGFDAYCHASWDAPARRFVLVHRQSVWTSLDGLSWAKARPLQPVEPPTDAENPESSIDVPGEDACLSRVEYAAPDADLARAPDGARGPAAGPRAPSPPDATFVMSARGLHCGSSMPRLLAVLNGTPGASGARGASLAHVPFGAARSVPPPVCPPDPASVSRALAKPAPTSQTASVARRALLSAAGDVCSTLHHAPALGADVLLTRANMCFHVPDVSPRCTDVHHCIRWREIRALEVRTGRARLAAELSREQRSADDAWPRLLRAYLDLDGKADRYRMQLYSLHAGLYPAYPAAAAPPADGSAPARPDPAPLHVGVMTVLNYAKTMHYRARLDMESFARHCASLRGGHALCETVDVHLVSSRDGAHFDAGWAYAREPLVQRPVRSARKGGMMFPCGPPVYALGQAWLFLAYIKSTHFERIRFGRRDPNRVEPRVARWPLHAMVGLRPAEKNGAGKGSLVTKPFAVPAGRRRWVGILVGALAPSPDAPTDGVRLPLVVASIRPRRGAPARGMPTAVARVHPTATLCAVHVWVPQRAEESARTAADVVSLHLRLRSASVYAVELTDAPKWLGVPSCAALSRGPPRTF